MKNRTFLLIAAGMLALVTLSCSLCRTGGSTGGGDSVTVTLVNNSGQTVCYVYISPTTHDTWGSDWLGSTETVAPGDRRAFSVPRGTYDLRADDCSQSELDVRQGVTISSSMEWVIR